MGNIHDIINLYEKILDFNIPDSLINYESNSFEKGYIDENSRMVNNYTFSKNSSSFYSICYNIYI